MKSRSPGCPRIVLAACITLAMTGAALAEREVTPLNADWLFLKGNADIAAPSSSWEKVTVPHCWNAIDAQAENARVSDRQETEAEATAMAAARSAAKKAAEKQGGPKDPHMAQNYYRGPGWYEHAIDIPSEWRKKRRIFVRFGAAGTVARTYLNKTLLGEHRGGFTAFCYEITDLVKYGSKNELRVEVDNSPREDLAPLSGDFNVCGGLYRGVDLIVTDEICISPLDYASAGVYLTTEALDAAKAIVGVTTIVSNGYRAAPRMTKETADRESSLWTAGKANVTLETEIKGVAGDTVATGSTNIALPVQATQPVTQFLSVTNPRLWKGRKDPYLYGVTVRLSFGGKTVDEVTQPLGLRTVAISQEKGFLLNGEPYPVHGVNRHQELLDKGWALTPEDEERDAAIIKEMGVTAIRNTHYPQSENWHRISDREGILLWNELSLVNETRGTRAFWANTEEVAREMVHQLHNHPSIAWWGMYNELNGGIIPPSDDQLVHLQSVIKEIDPRRLVVSATCQDNHSFNKVPDQIGYNTYPGWYQRGVEKMTPILDGFYREVGKRFAVTEYGAGGNVAHHVEGPSSQPKNSTDAFHPEEWQSHVHEQDWSRLKDNPKLWGSFVWAMFDFAVKSRNEGNTPALNDKGLVTHDRKIRKDAYFFYKANWNPDPMVHITSRRAVNRTLPVTDVKVYSNCPEVELTVNGKSRGTVKPGPSRIALWPKVELSPGENVLKVTGVAGGAKVHDTCTWNLSQPAKP